MKKKNKFAHGRPVVKYSLEGVLLKEFCSIADGCKDSGITDSNLRMKCKRQLCRDAIWFFRDHFKGRAPKLLKTLPVLANKVRVKVLCYTVNRYYLCTFRSVTEAAKAVNGNLVGVAQVLNRPNRVTYKGYIWRYANKENKSWPILSKRRLASLLKRVKPFVGGYYEPEFGISERL